MQNVTLETFLRSGTMIENLRTWYLAMAFTSFLKIINEQSIVISDKSTKYVDIAD
ncbi:hypothetical protein ZPR_3331 [Zunongwangia profunda SM-A87]|uniref:Uncharacterized protein n=1 Tax=Zunongwangia profunda (strain DSM 18752 / CCTCC AB 206139 / SM-A87) TaxID=655815 RepID=D5BJ14_ZUNPS|nr:hypothetical protein ZPR_3331 [Zunongwangia profunda SM-A87]